MEFGDGYIMVGRVWAAFVASLASMGGRIASRATFSSRMVSKFARTSLLACLCGKLCAVSEGAPLSFSDPAPGGLWTPPSVDSSVVFARLTKGGFALNINLGQGQDCR
jgi:hypothetical protein